MMPALFVDVILLLSIVVTSFSEHNVRFVSRNDIPKTQQQFVSTHVFKECIPLLSSRDDLARHSSISQGENHDVIFVIRQRNIEELTRILHDISNPLSSNYGHYLTKEEVQQTTTNPDSRDAVLSYLHNKGAIVSHKTTSGDYVKATAPISLWENIFNTKFSRFTQTRKNGELDELIRADNYSVPLELDCHLESVLNTVQVPYRMTRNLHAPERMKSVKTEANGQLDPFWGYATPAKIKAYYSIGASQGNKKSAQGVYSAVGQYFSPSDLRSFQTSFGLPLQELAKSIGGYSSDIKCVETPMNCAEGNLDVQYMMATSAGSPTTYWYSDQSFSEWLMDVAAATSPPLVISISYAADEASVSQSELIAFSTEAIKLGAMGVTLVAASGDDGAVSDSVRDYGDSKCGYAAMFPASNPYVLSVGATSGVEAGRSERVAQSDKGQSFTSGGGFSSYYSQPVWQNSAITGYFAAVASQSPLTGYNENGRGYPDVSISGCKHAVVLGGAIYMLSGTSAAAPVVAGMISNINAARFERGLGPVGWINPLLYMNHTAFVNDITSGSNNCAANGVCCPQGFTATPGWDPASGLGSVNYQKLEAVFLTLGGANTALRWPTYAPVLDADRTPSTMSTYAPTVAIYTVIEVSQVVIGVLFSQIVQDTFSDYLSSTLSIAINLPAVVTSFAITDKNKEVFSVGLKYTFFTFGSLQPQAVIQKLKKSVDSGLFLAAFKLQTGLAVTAVSLLTVQDVTPAKISSSSNTSAVNGFNISIIAVVAVLAGVCGIAALLIIAGSSCSRSLTTDTSRDREQRTPGAGAASIPVLSTVHNSSPGPQQGPSSVPQASVYMTPDPPSTCVYPLAY